MLTPRASASCTTVVHAALARPSSIRPSELIDTPERKASDSCVSPRRSRSWRSTAASAGSGAGARDIGPETSHAPDRQVHSESSQALTPTRFRRTLPGRHGCDRNTTAGDDAPLRSPAPCRTQAARDQSGAARHGHGPAPDSHQPPRARSTRAEPRHACAAQPRPSHPARPHDPVAQAARTRCTLASPRSAPQLSVVADIRSSTAGPRPRLVIRAVCMPKPP